MPVRIINRSRGLLTVELNSGDTLHLAPSETSPPLQDIEVTANRWVERLLDRDLIAVQKEKAEPKGGARPSGKRQRPA
jgi:hypothetical protein